MIAQRERREEYAHVSYYFLCGLFGLVVAFDFVFLEAGIALADYALDLGEFARLLLYSHGGLLWCVLCGVNRSCSSWRIRLCNACDGQSFFGLNLIAWVVQASVPEHDHQGSVFSAPRITSSTLEQSKLHYEIYWNTVSSDLELDTSRPIFSV